MRIFLNHMFAKPMQTVYFCLLFVFKERYNQKYVRTDDHLH